MNTAVMLFLGQWVIIGLIILGVIFSLEWFFERTNLGKKVWRIIERLIKGER